MGCLFALFAGIFPRLALFILWVARPARVDAAFDTFLLPLLGIIFLPALAGLLDIGHWAAGATQRNQLPGRRPSAA